MKYTYLLLLLVSYPLLYGQDPAVLDSLKNRAQFSPDSMENISETDTTRQRIVTKLDSIANLNLPVGQADSLRSQWLGQLDDLNNPSLLKSNRLDSLTRYRAFADSLKSLNLPHEKYVSRLDSLMKLPEEKVQGYLAKWKEKANKQSDRLGTKRLEDKVNAGIPDPNRAGFNAPGMDETGIDPPTDKIPTNEIAGKASGLEQDLGLSGDVSEIEKLKEELALDDQVGSAVDPLKEDLELDKLQEQVSDVKALPSAEVNKVKEAAGADKANKQLDKVSQRAEEGSEYAREVQAAADGDFTEVEERMEQKALKKAGALNDLEEQSALLEEARKEHEEYLSLQQEYIKRAQKYSDPAFVKQRIQEKSKYVANDQLKKYKSKVEDAQKELAELKMDSVKRFIEVKSAEEWPLRDRIIFGANLELLRNDIIQVDAAPYIGFMLDDRWHAYFSYMYRIRFNKDDSRVLLNNPVYGPRLSFTYRFYKGFYGLLSGEQVRVDVPKTGPADLSVREWRRGLFLGVGNRYNITPHMKGTVQLMYNFLHDNTSPYARPINIRMGFEIDLKQRVSRKDVINGVKKAHKRKKMLEKIKKSSPVKDPF
ncbi:hypothetical protein [Fulvivirga sp. M361]|uniref:hypothetical protein n=1 Tax=Fulvivirga sp. M361 TaxID=2594266 RepID=UPI0016292FDF|nr:hypothetical protein [Fulvivirga sp. M361]